MAYLSDLRSRLASVLDRGYDPSDARAKAYVDDIKRRIKVHPIPVHPVFPRGARLLLKAFLADEELRGRSVAHIRDEVDAEERRAAARPTASTSARLTMPTPTRRVPCPLHGGVESGRGMF